MIRRRLLKLKLRFSKRVKFVISTAVLTFGLLITYLAGPSYTNHSLVALIVLSSLCTVFSLWVDLPRRKQVIIILLPIVLFTAACFLFYFVLPARWATRIIMLLVFALGFYALLLVQNIYSISVSRTIKLLQAARTIGFLLAVTSAFGLYYTLYSLHTYIPLLAAGIFSISFMLILSVIWGVSYKEFVGKMELLHTFILTLVITQIGVLLTFWPVTVTFAAIFLAGFFYTFVGLSQHWLEHRLFKRVLWEYIWVAVVLVLVLFFTTRWGG